MSATIHPTKYGTFEVKWRESGSQRSKTLKTEVAAAKFADDVDQRLEEGKPVLRRRDVPMLKPYALHVLAEKDIEESTLRHSLATLNKHCFPYMGQWNLLDCRPRAIGQWRKERLAAGAGPRAIGQCQSILSGIFKKAVHDEYLDFNPMIGFEHPSYAKKEHRWLTAAEVEAMRQWYLGRKDFGSATLISLLGNVGIRPQDALALEAKHIGDRLQVVQRVSQGVIVPGAKNGRHRRRSVFLPEAVAVDLDNWLMRRKTSEKLLFGRQKDGKPWTKTDYDNWRQRKPRSKGKVLTRQKCFKTAAIECGLGEALTPYGLRHTAATMYLSSGWTVAEVAHQLGHSPAESMKTYQHIVDEHQGKPKQTVDEWINKARGVVPLFDVEQVIP